ncbi:hypothetical protein Ciccas_009760 [Cichlidogyrus casuarinus]|uniref:Uncharacterized protein n=1 Tax=Cichlidogyrus casuarinus TaxID=1844966 RepID=A0ABD2PW32_9PLAT
MMKKLGIGRSSSKLKDADGSVDNLSNLDEVKLKKRLKVKNRDSIFQRHSYTNHEDEDEQNSNRSQLDNINELFEGQDKPPFDNSTRKKSHNRNFLGHSFVHRPSIDVLENASKKHSPHKAGTVSRRKDGASSLRATKSMSMSLDDVVSLKTSSYNPTLSIEPEVSSHLSQHDLNID